MAEGADIRRGVQFAQDLKEIRKANGISIDDIHNESKIPVGLIESFEENGLFDHTMFNRVYLRSFVRTYADVVGISPETALASLEAALEGTYRRELAVEYLGLELPPEPVEDPEGTVIPEPEVSQSETTTRPRPAPRPVAPPHPETRATVEPISDEFETEGYEASETSWTSQSPPPGTRVSARRPGRGGSQWGYIVGAVLGIAVLAWVVMRLVGGGEEASPEPRSVAASDTVQTDSLALFEEPAPAPATIGDTLSVTIASADSQLVQGIRITVDNDVRRPYWLERGQSRTFRPAQQIVIEEQLDRVNVTVEGQPYPTNRVDDQGRLVITRDTALELLSASQ
ncbi:MAG TPA: helix-turn-helix transcriptional regulator [Rhodothermales bacterium]